MMEFGDMGSFGWIWMAAGLVFWVTVIALIAWTVGQMDRSGPTPANAEEILRRRYAGGEIDDNEFESARRTLRRS
jgi:uncharacterized membrane protein